MRPDKGALIVPQGPALPTMLCCSSVWERFSGSVDNIFIYGFLIEVWDLIWQILEYLMVKLAHGAHISAVEVRFSERVHMICAPFSPKYHCYILEECTVKAPVHSSRIFATENSNTVKLKQIICLCTHLMILFIHL